MTMCSDVQNRMGTPHIEMCLDTWFGTTHMPIKVFDQMLKLGWGHCTRSKMFKTTNAMGWVGNYSENNATSWIHLASWNRPNSELS